MIFDKMKIGYYGEKFRFQISGFKNFIIYGTLFILIGILQFLFQPLMLFFCISGVIIVAFLLVFLSKTLLIYNEGFIVTTLKNKSTIPQLKPLTEMEKVDVHISGFRGSSSLTFYYRQGEDISFVNFSIPIEGPHLETLQFLHKKGVKIYVDEEKYAEQIFNVSKNKLEVHDIGGTTWYFVR